MTQTNQEPDSLDQIFRNLSEAVHYHGERWEDITCEACEAAKKEVQALYAPKPDESVIVDGDAYYSKNLAILKAAERIAQLQTAYSVHRYYAKSSIIRYVQAHAKYQASIVEKELASLQQELESLKKEGE